MGQPVVDKDHPVFVTKWALAKGIMKFTEGEFISGCELYFYGKICGYPNSFGPKDYFLTEVAAQAHVQRMAKNKIKSLKKGIGNMEIILTEGVEVVEAPEPGP